MLIMLFVNMEMDMHAVNSFIDTCLIYAVSKLKQFHSPHICLCLSEETLKAGDPFYLVPGEVKDPTQGVNV